MTQGQDITATLESTKVQGTQECIHKSTAAYKYSSLQISLPKWTVLIPTQQEVQDQKLLQHSALWSFTNVISSSMNEVAFV